MIQHIVGKQGNLLGVGGGLFLASDPLMGRRLISWWRRGAKEPCRRLVTNFQVTIVECFRWIFRIDQNYSSILQRNFLLQQLVKSFLENPVLKR